MRIEDGAGRGYQAEVSSGLQLQTRALSVSPLHAASLNGDAYAWNAVSADIDAADTALLVRNDSDTRYLVIEKVYVYADIATTVDIHVIPNSTFTIAGTTVTGVNLNTGSGKVADATARADETGNTQGSIICTLATPELTTHQEGQWFEPEGGVILSKNSCLGVDIVGDSAAFECTIIGYFLDR